MYHFVFLYIIYSVTFKQIQLSRLQREHGNPDVNRFSILSYLFIYYQPCLENENACLWDAHGLTITNESPRQGRTSCILVQLIVKMKPGHNLCNTPQGFVIFRQSR